MKEKREHPFSDFGQIIFAIVFLIVWIADSFFLHKITFLSNYLPFYVRIISILVIILTAIYFIRSGHKAVDSNSILNKGGFAYIRHPLYLGCLLIYLGLITATLSIVSFILYIGIFTFYNYIASYEEKLLIARYGAGYEEYKRKTGKWLPKIFKGLS